MAEGRRVVVTGMGAITPIGHSVEEMWKSATAGVSGVGPITLFDASRIPTKIAAEVKGFDPEVYLPRRESRRGCSLRGTWTMTARSASQISSP